jgi:hypothetical protein
MKNGVFWVLTRATRRNNPEDTILHRIYTIIILPLILYGCKTWFLAVKEKQRHGVFEKRVLGILFGPKRDQITGGWK